MQYQDQKEIGISSDIESNDEILRRLLANVEAIKRLEQDNKQLQLLLMKNRELKKEINEKRLNELVAVLEQKDTELSDLKKHVQENYNRLAANFSRKLESEQKKNILLNRLLPELKTLKGENHRLRLLNAKTKFILKKEYEKKLKEHELNLNALDARHKNVLKEHETSKIGLKKDIEQEKQRNIFLVQKHKELLDRLEALEKEHLEIKKRNRQMLAKIDQMDKTTLANEKRLQEKARSMREELETKLKEVSRDYLGREIEYRARIDSLNNDLGRYVSELKEFKQKYFMREKQIKEKIRSILN